MDSRYSIQFRNSHMPTVLLTLEELKLDPKNYLKHIQKILYARQAQEVCNLFSKVIEINPKSFDDSELKYIGKCLEKAKALWEYDKEDFTATQLTSIQEARKLAYLHKAKILAYIFINRPGKHKHTELSHIFNIMSLAGYCQSVDDIYYEPDYVHISLTKNIVDEVIQKNTFDEVNNSVEFLLKHKHHSIDALFAVFENIEYILSKFTAPYNMQDWQEYTLAGNGLKLSNEDITFVMDTYQKFLEKDLYEETS